MPAHVPCKCVMSNRGGNEAPLSYENALRIKTKRLEKIKVNELD
jgi:hypothetical protein